MTRGLGLLLLLLPTAAWAHAGPHRIEVGPPGWTLDAWVTVPLLLAAAFYLAGFIRLRRRSAGGRPTLARQARLFALGWLALAAAAVSPLHEAGERSFAMHMIEHELIMLAAGWLLAASRPVGTMLWALPMTGRQEVAGFGRMSIIRRPWRFATDPFVATLLQATAMWLWHMPALFDRALGHQGWHIAQHLSFLATALIFWWSMLRARHGLGVSALCLFATSMVGGALGALMAVSESPWYAGYAAMGMTPWGLTPAEDQQLAGLLMWVPGGLVHAGAALWLVAHWLRDPREEHHAVALD